MVKLGSTIWPILVRKILRKSYSEYRHCLPINYHIKGLARECLVWSPGSLLAENWKKPHLCFPQKKIFWGGGLVRYSSVISGIFTLLFVILTKSCDSLVAILYSRYINSILIGSSLFHSRNSKTRPMPYQI